MFNNNNEQEEIMNEDVKKNILKQCEDDTLTINEHVDKLRECLGMIFERIIPNCPNAEDAKQIILQDVNLLLDSWINVTRWDNVYDFEMYKFMKQEIKGTLNAS